MKDRPPRPLRDAYPWRMRATSRWRDADVYGHLNNVMYLEFFDTAVARWLRETGALDVPFGPVIGLVVETTNRFFAAIHFMEEVEVGLAAERVGRTSATYSLALFGAEPEAAATCRFVHVYVDAATRRPVPLPESLRAALATVQAARD